MATKQEFSIASLANRIPDEASAYKLLEELRWGGEPTVCPKCNAAGKFYFAGDESQRVILVAGGVGITPMMAVIRSLTDRCWTGNPPSLGWTCLCWACRRS